MSEAAARFRQPIDLDEFERRLRAGNTSSPTGKTEDPLAELARLVGQEDPFRAAPIAPQLRPAATARDAVKTDRGPVPHLQQVHPPLDRPDPPFGQPEALAMGDPAAMMATPEPELVLFADESAAVSEIMAAPPGADHEFAQAHPQPEFPFAAAIAAAEVPRRSWRGVIILSTVLATGFAGLAAALTMKGSTFATVASNVGASKPPPVILAAGPTKVQPPKSAADTPDDPPSVLDKAAAAKPAKAKIVDSVERPVDLSQQPPASRPVAPAPAAVAKAASIAAPPPSAAVDPSPVAANPPARQIASIDPTAASPASLAGTAPSLQGSRAAPKTATDDAESRPTPTAGQNGFPAPKRVKIVSVRPDGSIIGNDSEAAPPALAPTAVPAEPPPQVELGVAMPNAAAPAPPRPVAPPAAALRVAEQPVDGPAADARKRGNDPVAALIDPARGEKRASTKDAGTANAAGSDPSPAPAPKSKHGKKKNTEVADLGTRANDADGTYAAQLAASPTEAAARSTLRKLQKKYGGSFTGHKLSYRRVKVDGKTVYRVRVTGLSKDDADSVCSKLQSDGGTCFVANN